MFGLFTKLFSYLFTNEESEVEICALDPISEEYKEDVFVNGDMNPVLTALAPLSFASLPIKNETKTFLFGSLQKKDISEISNETLNEKETAHLLFGSLPEKKEKKLFPFGLVKKGDMYTLAHGPMNEKKDKKKLFRSMFTNEEKKLFAWGSV